MAKSNVSSKDASRQEA